MGEGIVILLFQRKAGKSLFMPVSPEGYHRIRAFLFSFTG
jgi:hypothetical protein